MSYWSSIPVPSCRREEPTGANGTSAFSPSDESKNPPHGWNEAKSSAFGWFEKVGVEPLIIDRLATRRATQGQSKNQKNASVEANPAPAMTVSHSGTKRADVRTPARHVYFVAAKGKPKKPIAAGME